MTIFDVIRYPISECPTEKELNDLPADLLYAWVQTTPWGQSARPDIITIVNYYRYTSRYVLNTIMFTHVEINLLRKMIWDYEPL